jgi:hypothetical protein
VSTDKPSRERRIYPRLEKNIPLKISQDEGDIVTETANISRSGAYCRVNKYIPPMTKLKIYLLLPIRKNGKNTTKKITCQGVVVRTEPVQGKEYCNIAIFFNEIAQRDAESIADFVNSYLEHEKRPE